MWNLHPEMIPVYKAALWQCELKWITLNDVKVIFLLMKKTQKDMLKVKYSAQESQLVQCEAKYDFHPKFLHYCIFILFFFFLTIWDPFVCLPACLPHIGLNMYCIFTAFIRCFVVSRINTFFNPGKKYFREYY